MDRSDTIENIAAALRQAHHSGVPIAPVRAELAENDLDQAYEVQEANTRFWLNEGRRLVGRKIGLTSPAVQKQLGVDQPDFGMLFADMAMPEGIAIPASLTMQPKIEAEIALILDRDLTVEQAGVADIIRATAYVAPAFEIVGSRIANWDIRITDTIADNASSGLFVLGGPARRIDGLDLAGCRMTMTRGGEVVSEGSGSACLGHPLNAAAWLASEMVRRERPLLAGDVILTGALGPMVPANAGDEFEAEISGIGRVRASFAQG
ncbi:2-keto-4-pentenoate hydratase [Cereibacter sp. SYSU M97828]|nr:2-keto-4-pentenoate hydratase [Cereibacter flavus]